MSDQPIQSDDAGVVSAAEAFEAADPAASAQPSAKGTAKRRAAVGRRQFRISQLMFIAVVISIPCFFIGRAFRTGEESHAIQAGAAISAIVLLGGWRVVSGFRRGGSVGWILIFFGIFGVTASLIGGYSIVLTIFLVVILVGLSSRYRSLQQDVFLWSIALAADRSMPLAPAIRAFSSDLGTRYRRRAREVAEALEAGMALPEALEFSRGTVSQAAVVLSHVGWDAGALPLALRRATTASASREASRSLGGAVAYLSLMTVGIQIIFGFVVYFIIPKFEAIFADFGIAIPAVTRAVIDFSGIFTRSLIGPILFVVEIAALLYLPWAMQGLNTLRVPLIDRWLIGRHRVMVLESLSVVVDSGRPIALGVLSLSRCYPARWVRNRLARAWTAIEMGLGWADALRAEGLLADADAEVLYAAERLGNLGWAVRELGANSRRRHEERLQTFTRLGFVVVVLGLGALVGLICFAFFAPLIQLIMQMST
ncbi:MAG: type II secretion system F family protein [Isosphaeraceae bacterium]|nr:type II secretion system F family protein [Isosphaeraceae bacterium]